MKNQETKTKMTEQEKQELMDLMSKTMEEDSKAFNKMHTEFLAQHDFSNKPDRQTRAITAWTRENMVLDSWNQFIECEAKMAEFAGWEKEGKGFRTFYDQRRCDVALAFAHYFLASMEQAVKCIDEDLKQKETI
jgi:hypothetical protein